ncbi:MAG TPA: EAL domain-containing protein [Solirubrobacteraceae bacterium]|jgi:EAL domain-containing protein (putative c-di-GMP-specific phosphodiesterase class I)|nr:EAL domain-containing protein [Solirubrobacteraceae bacterium]
MRSSTIAATPRFVLRAQRWPSGSAGPVVARVHPAAAERPLTAARRRCVERADLGGSGLCSVAGLPPRPWLARLRRALREDLFELHYQPILDLRSGAIAHHEALVRLADEPEGMLTAPGAFLPAAERYGLVREIDRMVVGRVAAALAAHDHTQSLPSVALNVSALSVTDAGMLAYIERQLARHRVDPARLVVEITETAAISDMRRAIAFCEGVQALGCAIALDDFGVGFGSLYYAKRLPFRYLKIDGDFVRALPTNAHDRVMVRAIVDLARGLGRQTIAEFVGDEPTLGVLRELGVDYAQGFQIGRPRPLVAV